MPGAPLSLPECEEIAVALTTDPGVSWASIGRRIGRDPTTIAREVNRHGARPKYRPATADRTAQRNRRRPRTRLAHLSAELIEQIATELRQGRSPEAIWADLRAEGATVRPCTETTYQGIYAGTFGVPATECLRSRRPPRQARHPNKQARLPNIDGRPDPVNFRPHQPDRFCS